MASAKPPDARLSQHVVCPKCEAVGHAWASPLRWMGQRYILYTCTACGHAWSIAERRDRKR